MILRVEEIPKSEMHLVPIIDLRQQIQWDRQDGNEQAVQERSDCSATTDPRRRSTPAL